MVFLRMIRDGFEGQVANYMIVLVFMCHTLLYRFNCHHSKRGYNATDKTQHPLRGIADYKMRQLPGVTSSLLHQNVGECCTAPHGLSRSTGGGEWLRIRIT